MLSEDSESGKSGKMPTLPSFTVGAVSRIDRTYLKYVAAAGVFGIACLAFGFLIGERSSSRHLLLEALERSSNQSTSVLASTLERSMNNQTTTLVHHMEELEKGDARHQCENLTAVFGFPQESKLWFLPSNQTTQQLGKVYVVLNRQGTSES